jgi:hypothetical protein
MVSLGFFTLEETSLKERYDKNKKTKENIHTESEEKSTQQKAVRRQ